MTFEEYMKQNAPTAEQLERAERERQAEQERQKAQEEAKTAQEEALRQKAEKEPTKEEKAAAARIFKGLQQDITLGRSPAALLLEAVNALGLLLKIPKQEIDKMRESLEVIQGKALGDPGLRGVEIAEIENRLQTLEEAINQGRLDYSEKKLVERSIRANKKRLSMLQEQAKEERDSFLS